MAAHGLGGVVDRSWADPRFLKFDLPNLKIGDQKG
jgi:hypothetical protein